MQGHRVIQGLLSASRSENPWPRERIRGAKAQGLRYQRSFSKTLASALGRQGIPPGLANPWYEFTDAHGRGMCSPDHVVFLRGSILVFECKLTDCPEAYSQLDKLYRPVLQKCYSLQVLCCVVANYLTPDSLRPCTTIEEVVNYNCQMRTIPLWHWRPTRALSHADPAMMLGHQASEPAYALA